jgi:hypothetical protein
VKTAITAIIALSAAALTATAPAVFAQGALSKSPSVQHVSKKRHPGVSGYSLRHETQAKGPRAFGYALPGSPMEPNPNAGGGGGGGSGM